MFENCIINLQHNVHIMDTFINGRECRLQFLISFLRRLIKLRGKTLPLTYCCARPLCFWSSFQREDGFLCPWQWTRTGERPFCSSLGRWVPLGFLYRCWMLCGHQAITTVSSPYVGASNLSGTRITGIPGTNCPACVMSGFGH